MLKRYEFTVKVQLNAKYGEAAFKKVMRLLAPAFKGWAKEACMEVTVDQPILVPDQVTSVVDTFVPANEADTE
jgi:hypothetical protein